MALDESSEIVRALESSREEVNAAVSAISDARAGAKPDAVRWSVLECLEHIAAAEERFLVRLESAERTNDAGADSEKETKLAAVVVDRSVRVRAPEAVAPKGRFTSVAHALDHFNATRARTIRFAQDRGTDLYQLAAEHPRFGPVNGNELMLIIAGHARRHAEQIRELTAAMGNA